MRVQKKMSASDTHPLRMSTEARQTAARLSMTHKPPGDNYQGSLERYGLRTLFRSNT